MSAFLLITAKSALALTLFYGFYRYVLASDKLFIRNRFFLLGSAILSLILPWIKIPIFPVEVSDPLTFVYVEGNSTVISESNSPLHGASAMQILQVIYFIGVAFFLLRMLVAYFQVFRIIRRAFHSAFGKLKLVTTHRNLSPFSFFHWIVVPNSIYKHPSFDKMVQHEEIHCRQYHSVDLFIAEMLISLQWFNPFAWLLRKSISENLEYLVDDRMLAIGNNAKEYQYSLLSFSMVDLKPAVANNFNSNLLKKRIAMMNKSKYPRKYRFHSILIPVCLFIALLVTVSFQRQVKAEAVNSLPAIQDKAVAAVSENVAENSDVQKAPEITAVASGVNGEETFLKFVAENILYPKEAVDCALTGTVEVVVTFSSDGVSVKSAEATDVQGLSRMKNVIVMGYGKNSSKSTGVKVLPTSLLKSEVERVVKAFKNVPEDLSGKTFVVPVKFMLDDKLSGQDVKVTGYATEKKEKNVTDEFITVLEEADKTSANSEPVYILNDEKIISKADADAIDPESIEAVNVVKAKKVQHKALGTINGSVIVIHTKK
jgi:beta-lactamase regulating signal transducer with metallopeptidase domain